MSKLKKLLVPAATLLVSVSAWALPAGSIDGIVEMRESSSGKGNVWEILVPLIMLPVLCILGKLWDSWYYGRRYRKEREAEQKAHKAEAQRQQQCHQYHQKPQRTKGVFRYENGKRVN